LALSSLPADARVICVVVGTGIELLNLAFASQAAKLRARSPRRRRATLCRQTVTLNTLSDRCALHEGTPAYSGRVDHRFRSKPISDSGMSITSERSDAGYGLLG
jgi:hypothetical protein